MHQGGFDANTVDAARPDRPWDGDAQGGDRWGSGERGGAGWGSDERRGAGWDVDERGDDHRGGGGGRGDDHRGDDHRGEGGGRGDERIDGPRRRRLWGRRRADRAGDPRAERTTEGPARTSSWTAGRARSTKLQSTILWLAIACGPAALVGALLAPEPPVVPPAAVQEPAGPSAAEVRAGAVATGFVGAWLSATRDDRAGLDAFVPDLEVTTTVATPSRDLALAALVPIEGRDIVSVVVAATVQEGDAGGGVAWNRRYYQVAVAAPDEGPVTVLGAPALVPAPEVGEPEQPAGLELAPSDPVTRATGLFLTALLTGGADLDRFVAPGAPIAPVIPAAYATVQLGSVRTEATPSPAPADGESVQVSADLTAVTATEATATLRYWLTLTARDGRWEIASIDPAPVLAGPATSQPPVAETATPSDDGTGGADGTEAPDPSAVPEQQDGGDGGGADPAEPDAEPSTEPEPTTETEP